MVAVHRKHHALRMKKGTDSPLLMGFWSVQPATSLPLRKEAKKS